MTTIEDRIKSYKLYEEVRNARKLKDATVAQRAGVSKATFSDWKSGRSKPKYEKMLKITRVLRVGIGRFEVVDGKQGKSTD